MRAKTGPITEEEIIEMYEALGVEPRASKVETIKWYSAYLIWAAYVLFISILIPSAWFFLPVMNISFSTTTGAVNDALMEKFKTQVPQGQAPKSPAVLRAERLANWNAQRTRITIWISNVPRAPNQISRPRDFAGNWWLMAMSVVNGTTITISGGATWTQDDAGRNLWNRYFNNTDVNERGFLDDLTAHYYGANGKSASGSRHYFPCDLVYATQLCWYSMPSEMTNVAWGTGVAEQYNAYVKAAVAANPKKLEVLSRIARLMHGWGYPLDLVVGGRIQALMMSPLGFTHPGLSEDDAVKCRNDLRKIIDTMAAKVAANKLAGKRESISEVTGLTFFKKS